MQSECETFVVIGGGIAGVSCAETLISYSPNCNVVIVTASPLIKAVRNIQELTRTLVSFDVKETAIKDFETENPQIKICHSVAAQIDHVNKILIVDNGKRFYYSKLCVCTGARPKYIFPDNKYVIGIRDTATAVELDKKLKNSHRVVVVGNGGIATELVFQISECEVVWAIKDNAIGQVFFDPGAAEFFLPLLQKKKSDSGDAGSSQSPLVKRMNYELATKGSRGPECQTKITGSALGPDWHQSLNLKGEGRSGDNIIVEYGCEVKQLYENLKNTDITINKKSNGSDWPVVVELTNGKVYGCDFIISATGVEPNNTIFDLLPCNIASDGGVEIDQNMRVCGLKHVYAAGDICSTLKWPWAPHWHQMRLWTQARQMGAFAAQCMVKHGEAAQLESDRNQVDILPDICFDLFAHVTRFFGKKVCLLGRYNAQDLDKDKLELLLRTTPGDEYIKVVLMNGRMQGAVLIGETDLEETFENLILNGTDLSFLGEDLLDPNVDIADYFDWLADYSSCKQLCQDVAELINDRNTDARAGANVVPINLLIKKDLLNLKSMMEKLKMDLIRSAKLNTTTHGEVERRQNLLDTLTTKVRILNDAAEHGRCVSASSVNCSERASLLSTEAGSSRNGTNPWLESEERISALTTEQFHQRQQQVMKEQDAGLDLLSQTLSRQKQIGLTIGNEAEFQNHLIDDIHGRVENTDQRIKQETEHIVKVHTKSSTCGLWIVIVLLGIAIIVIAATL